MLSDDTILTFLGQKAICIPNQDSILVFYTTCSTIILEMGRKGLLFFCYCDNFPPQLIVDGLLLVFNYNYVF